MADVAHKKTDEMLTELEKKIKREYNTARKEVQGKMNAYFEKVAAQEKVQKELLKAGKITQQEYNDWMIRKMAMGKRWEELRDNLANDMNNHRKIAQSITKGFQADAYALNHNFAVYQCEHDGKCSTVYQLYDRHTVERLMEQDQQLMPPAGRRVKQAIKEGRAKRWNKQRLQSALTQSILQGESVGQIADRVSRTVSVMSYNDAIRYARTMITGAECAGRNDGFKAAEDMGIDLEKEWIATLDDRTRHSHREMHGVRVPVDDVFPNGCRFPADPYGDPSEVYNCFVAETNVTTDSNIIRSYKHEYEGELIKIKTASGVNFTCTPNHPILSDRGWVRVASLNEGNNLLVARFGDEIFTRRNPHVNHVHARMDTLHKFLDVLGSQRTTTMSVNFHGDIPTSEVEVVTFKGLLRNNFNLGRCKAINKFLLKFTNKTLSCKGTLVEHFGSICLVAFGFICRMSKPFSIIGRCLRHTQIHRFGTVARNNASFTKSQIDNISTASEFCGECFDRRSIEIFADNIISIDRCISNCHVYNLQTENGRYFVNSSITENGTKCNDIYAIAHNCRCTMKASIKGFDRQRVESSPKMGGLSFEEWQELKR